MKPLELSPQAARELEKAAAWYEERQSGLGNRLLVEFDEIVLKVRDHPSASPRVRGLPPDLIIRWGALPTFPDHLIFLELAEAIHGVAVSHVRQRPGYWLPRVAAR